MEEHEWVPGQLGSASAPYGSAHLLGAQRSPLFWVREALFEKVGGSPGVA